MLARAILICLHRQNAEDAVADAYLKAFAHWDRVSGYPPRAAEKWVHTTMKRDLWKAGNPKKKGANRNFLEVPIPSQSSVEETVEARRVLGAVAHLPQRQRVVLVAHCLEGRSQDDVAQELGVTRGAVAAHVFQARRTLERLLGLTPPAPALPGLSDQLVQVPGRASPSVLPGGADQVASLLRDVEVWLAEGIEADGQELGRIRAAVASRLANRGPGRERPW